MKQMARNVAKLDNQGLTTRELRFQVYKMGLYYYREIHKAGIPVDFMNPSLSGEKLVWDKESHQLVPESDMAKPVAA